MTRLTDIAFGAAGVGLILSCVIFPNSLKLVSAACLAVAALCALTRLRIGTNELVLLLTWSGCAALSATYIVVGLINGAPSEAAGQVFLIYIAFPLLWIAVAVWLFQAFPLRIVVRSLVVGGAFGAVTIAIFYYAFLSGWQSVATFFIETPNVDTNRSGYVAATMYVYGSLIFVVGGYMASFSIGRGSRLRYLLLALFLLAALSSGRSALMLAILIGACLNFLVAVRKLPTLPASTLVRGGVLLGIACAFVIVVIARFDLQVSKLISPMLEKIVTFGGPGRQDQLEPLLSGAENALGLGAGHGVGVEYRVDPRFPWRYEMVWFASVFRVGVVGALVYALPFLVAAVAGLRAWLANRLDRDELFLLGGFLAAFVASNTNPYVEAFVFQWMYVIPIVYFSSGRFWRFGNCALNVQSQERRHPANPGSEVPIT